MVLVGKVNKDIVLLINRHGQPAVGLCGDDGLLFRASRQPAPSGQDIGFVGRIDHVDVSVLIHVAQDYIPVVASVGADREGNSYNINADEAAGAVARALGAYKVMFLTDVAGWLRDPADPSSVVSEAGDRRGRGALPSVAGGMRPKLAACLEAIAGRRLLRPHRRRPRAALAAARAVHRRRAGHQDRTARMSAARAPGARARARDRHLRPQPGRVRPRRGCSLWDDDGNEYLDFLAGISVLNVGHCHPRVVQAVREQVGRLTHVTNLYYTEPAMRLSAPAGPELAGRQGVPLQLGRRGQRGGDQAVSPRPARRRDRGRPARRSTAAPTGRCRPPRRSPSRRRSRRWCRGSSSCPRTPRRSTPPSARDTAAVLLEPIQGETGINVLSDELLRAAREACDRTGAALVFDEIQTGMGRTGTLWAYEQTGVVPDAMTSRQGARRRAADRRADHRRAARRRVRSPATTARRSPAARSSPRPRSSRSRSARTRAAGARRRTRRAPARRAGGAAVRRRRSAGAG